MMFLHFTCSKNNSRSSRSSVVEGFLQATNIVVVFVAFAVVYLDRQHICRLSNQ